MSVQNNNNFEILNTAINKKLQFFTSVFVYAKKKIE